MKSAKLRVAQTNRKIRLSYRKTKPKSIPRTIPDKRNLVTRTPFGSIVVKKQANPVKIRYIRSSDVVAAKNARKGVKKIRSAKGVQSVIHKRNEIGQRIARRRRTPQMRRTLQAGTPQVSRDEHTKKIKALKNHGVGKILVMLAPGPSILEIPIEKLNNVPKVEFMTINKPDLRLWPTDFWAFCDQTQCNRNQEMWNSYGGIIINSGAVRSRKSNQIVVRSRPGKGFSRDLVEGYYIGRSSTYANMQMALWMNYDKIFICGVDMARVTIKKKDGQEIDMLHSYGTNPDVPEAKRVERFKYEAENYAHGASQLTSEECQRFCFCTTHNPWPFIEQFDHIKHYEAVDKIIEASGQL